MTVPQPVSGLTRMVLGVNHDPCWREAGVAAMVLAVAFTAFFAIGFAAVLVVRGIIHHS